MAAERVEGKERKEHGKVEENVGKEFDDEGRKMEGKAEKEYVKAEEKIGKQKEKEMGSTKY